MNTKDISVVQSLRADYKWSGVLRAYWEVDYDPISDNYTPEDTSARFLFSLWSAKVTKKYPNQLIPICWFVSCPEAGKLEFMPFQCYPSAYEDFLAFYTWPINKRTGERINWLTLPVVDKHWNAQHADKGGFIQELTGWKPSILQPFVYLPALRQEGHTYEVR